jgi:asparagine synthase (glutamine-hydrolysing)
MDPLHRMLAWDQQNYLPDDHLVRVDRASMSTALEARAPLLDQRVVEFAWKLPPSLKLRDGVGKWILRQVLYRHVPQAIVERPKQGFSVPIEHWLRGSLREWAETLLSRPALEQDGLLNAGTVRAVWERHLAGDTDAHHELWAVLMYRAWQEESKKAVAA